MQYIIDLQYSIAQYFLDLIQSIQIPYFGIFMSNYPLAEIKGIIYITIFFLSLISWVAGRFLCYIFKTRLYNIENYKLVLLFNGFYLIPFIYGFFGGRLRITTIFILFIGSGLFVGIDIFLTQPERVIDFFN